MSPAELWVEYRVASRARLGTAGSKPVDKISYGPWCLNKARTEAWVLHGNRHRPELEHWIDSRTMTPLELLAEVSHAGD